jgi:acyl-coenzyme A thioesterase PaaI-like protein
VANPTAGLTEFGRATAVTPLGEGRYGCTLDPDWSTVVGVNGGVLTAILIHAIEAEIGTDRQIRSLTTHFMRPPKPGEATITLEILRTGRRATNLRARLEQDGKLMLESIAVCFTGGLRELITWSPPMPVVDPPERDLPEIEDPRKPPIADRVRFHPRIGPPPLSGTPLEPGEPARTGGWLEFTDAQRVTPAVLGFMVDAWWPAAIGPIQDLSFNPTIDLTFHQRTALPPEGLPAQPLLLDITTIASLEGLVDEDVRLFSADGALLAQARQLAITLTPEDRPLITTAEPKA